MAKHFKYGANGLRRGIRDIADIKARCEIDKATHCWHWKGAKSKGLPRIHVLDLRDNEKRNISGPLGLWMLAHNEVPNGIPMRRCLCRDCMNPAHLILMRNQAEISNYTTRHGANGTGRVMRPELREKAMQRLGVVPTPMEIIIAIREADRSITGRALAAKFDMHISTVSRIRRRELHKWLDRVQPAAQ